MRLVAPCWIFSFPSPQHFVGMLILPWLGQCYWRNALIYNVVFIFAKCVMQVFIQHFNIHPTALYFLSACVLYIGLDRSTASSRAMMLDIIMDLFCLWQHHSPSSVVL
ncbi:hypothetical protein TraAM80_02361 [Trypanosoma rangeli]|uniref:Uncharacterized protein n=1 Tax=Trypanosoma rangeli TaxID=5698 RepID=A0A3R7NWV3_TRYRA|nr:uncharacterized protein TraAM80_02361 [Trypanosoma rangeli]RNF08954.1 hypothetical protein TraAM80_02361 [Trypanosoma rangeli]|eukprot:RNF08954.1 hypothetical protein TraAM80_02361 [Trypanosoma rangeli]